MTLPSWPYVRQRPAGYVDDGTDVPSAAELSAIDEQLSRAADGNLWNDVALVLNFSAPVVLDHLTSLAYEPVRGTWFAGGGVPGPNPHAAVSYDSARTWDDTFATGIPAGTVHQCVGTDGLGTVIAGYSLPSSSATKAIFTTDGFATHGGVVFPSSTTAAMVSIYYSARLLLWIATLGDGSLWTATTPGGTWTQRVAPGSLPIYSFCESADRIVALSADSGGHLVWTSTDGLVWTSSVLASVAWVTFVPGPEPGYFLAITTGLSGERTYKSVDGSSWTLASTSAPRFPLAIASYGRMAMIIAGDSTAAFWDLYYTLNGISWKRSRSFHVAGASISSASLVVGAQQVVAKLSGSSDSFCRGIRGGF